MEFTHTPYSVARFPVPRSWYECLHVSFNIKPQYNDGVLLLITGSNNVDFLRLVLKGGVVHLDYDLGSGRGETESHQIRTKTWSSIRYYFLLMIIIIINTSKVYVDAQEKRL